MRDGAPSTTAVIAAAGAGERLGVAQPKALVELAGRPMLEWSLHAFAATPAVASAVIAGPPADLERCAELAHSLAEAWDGDDSASLEVRVVAGGSTRSESVTAALEHVAGELVAVHDAARPLVTPELIRATIDTLIERSDAAGVIAATPLTDTVKRARKPRGRDDPAGSGRPAVARTESREHLWAAQTPQVFRTAALRDAVAASRDRLAQATDDAWLVEKHGGKVLLHPAPPENIKVTTEFDRRVAELVLSTRRQ